MAICRACQAPLTHMVVDLGMTPLSNAYLTADQLHGMEPFLPLRVYVCGECFLVQLEALERPERVFSDYLYFSSYSQSWLAHCQRYAESVVARFGLHRDSRVIEIASNDGYLLQYFREREIPVLGIEPAANVAAVAQERGIPTLVKFFGLDTATELARQGIQADLLVGNNVLAHVPDLCGFVAGVAVALKPRGVATFEFPHLLRLMEGNQFDTIYHEHLSYLAFGVVERIFADQELTLFDVEELPTHGGSLRIYARHAADGEQPVAPRVAALRQQEREAGLTRLALYAAFQSRVQATKRGLLRFLIEAKTTGKSIVGYGAPAKGNTLLNYCGIGTDFLDYTVDRSPHKQARFLPGSHIPIHHPDRIRETKPDYVLILPWNLREEIVEQMGFIRDWGGAFVVPIPEVAVIP